jgi:hypothetical protein
MSGFSLPVVPRVGSETARKLLRDNLRNFRTVALGPREYERLVLNVADEGVTGGAIYDAIQIEFAQKIAREPIHTFEVNEFRRLARDLARRVTAP